MDPWWDDFFTGPWEQFHLGFATPEQSEKEARQIVKLLDVAPGGRLLDAPCGPGRHARVLARDGYRVTGIDLNAALLEEAKKGGETVTWVRSDLRQMNLTPASFEAAYCFWGSFGFFDDAGDRAFAAAVARALVPGGRFCIDVPTIEALARLFTDRSWREAGSVLTLEERAYEPRTGRIEAKWTFLRDGERVTKPMSFRLYSAHELCEQLTSAGFSDVQLYESLDGRPWHLATARRTYAVARKGD